MLNIKGINISIKRQRFPNCRKKHGQLYAMYENLTSETIQEKAEGWKRIYYTNTNYKKDGVAILISYKVFQNK